MGLTIEESTTEQVPPMLEHIIRSLQTENKAGETIQKDFLFILVVILMMENGFVPLERNSEEVSDIKLIDTKQLAKWKSGGHIEALFAMKGFENILIKVIMCPLGAAALINIVISDLDIDTYSVCLPISRYVVSPEASTIPMIFRDLKHLSVTFKNKVLSAVKSRILTFCGYPSASLMGLPEEVLYKILMNLTITSIVNVSKTCKRLKFLLESQTLWHELWKRDLSETGQGSDTECDWKTKYVDAYKKKQDNVALQMRRRIAGTMHDHMDYSDLISYIDNPMWDIII